MKEHPVVFDPAIWDSIESEVITPVLDALDKKIAPRGSPGWSCRQCSYQHSCPSVKGAKDYAKSDARLWGRATAR